MSEPSREDRRTRLARHVERASAQVRSHPAYRPELDNPSLVPALEAEVDRLEARVVELTRENADLIAEIAEARASLAAAGEGESDREAKCDVCGHEWRRHDPEDGQCDAHTAEPGEYGPCQCGRDLAWMQRRIAGLSSVALGPGGGVEPSREAEAMAEALNGDLTRIARERDAAEARVGELEATLRAELTHGGVRDELAQAAATLGGYASILRKDEWEYAEQVMEVGLRLDRMRDEFAARVRCGSGCCG